MNVTTINRLPSVFDGFRVGKRRSNSGPRLNKKQREAFRETQKIWLDMSLRIINSTQPSTPLVLGITSSMQGEGKTTNCVGIGSALSKEIDERVLLIECDLVNPSLASQLDMDEGPGLADSIQGYDSLEDIVRSTPIQNMDVVLAGGSRPDDGEHDILNQPLLSSLRRRLPNILTVFKQSYRFIVLDMPPMLSSPYTRDLLKYTDGAFLSVKAGITPNENLANVADIIGEDKLSGVILVGSDSPLPNWLVGLIEG